MKRRVRIVVVAVAKMIILQKYTLSTYYYFYYYHPYPALHNPNPYPKVWLGHNTYALRWIGLGIVDLTKPECCRLLGMKQDRSGRDGLHA